MHEYEEENVVEWGFPFEPVTWKERRYGCRDFFLNTGSLSVIICLKSLVNLCLCIR